MSKLVALKKQIAALEAQAERIAKEEMASAIAKVKNIMAEFNLTIEHLTHTVASKRAATKTKAKAKAKKNASAAKYADPKTGKTWTGVGRAPAWIAGAKNRDAFLVVKSAAPEAVAKAAAASKKAPTKAAKKAKVARPAAKRAAAPAKKTSKAKAASVPAKKTPAAKKSAAKKAAPKSVRSKQVAAAPVESAASPAV